jgi:transposase
MQAVRDSMQLEDARSLSSGAQQVLRKRAIAAVGQQQRPQGQVAQELGVSRRTVNRWVQRYRALGEPALEARKQGGPPRPKLTRKQLIQTTRLIRDQAPEQLELPYALWTREAVGQLIQQQWGVQLSQQAVGNYLRAWGLSPQKPAKRAREQCPEAVRCWMEYQYPALHRRAQREGTQIHWGDEMGLRSDHQTGTCWSPKGKTPIVETTGQRFGCNVISSLSNRGTLRFQVFEGSFTTEVFLDFLRRLVRSVPRKVFLVVDRHPVHQAHQVQQWVAQHSDQLKLLLRAVNGQSARIAISQYPL